MKKNIPVACPALNGNEKRYVLECLDTSWISSVGRFIPLFEEAFGQFCGAQYAVACNNGTAALHLALTALGVAPGDEVIVPTLTFIATANAVTYCGATPVLVDAEPQSMNIDPSRIEERITPRTKGIIVVHLYGHPADMDPILAIARKHGLFVVEDAAEAHGARYKGRPVGSLADAATFSFYGNKIITTGEGGMATTSDPALRDRLRLLRGQGMDPEKRYWFPIVGFNYRMTNIAAAIGLAQLEQIDQYLAGRKQIARWYDSALGPHSDIVSCPLVASWANHAFWSYPVLLSDNLHLERDEFAALLQEDGIETRPVFHPMHTLPPHRDTSRPYPVADDLSRRGLSLPMHNLLTADDISYIADRIHLRSVSCA